MVTNKTRSISFITSALIIVATVQSPIALSLSLSEAYHLALENDPKFAIAKEEAQIGLELKKSARAALLPQIQAFATHIESTSESSGEFPITLDQDQNPLTAEIRALRPVDSESDTATTSWGVSLNQELFNLPTWFSYKQGKFQSRQAELQFALDQLDLINRVINSYLEVLRSQEHLEVAKSLELAETKLLSQSERLKKAGLKTTIDVYQAEAAVDISRVLRLEAETAVQEASAMLSYITGEVNANLWHLPKDISLAAFKIGGEHGWVQTAKENNFSVRIADAKRAASRAASSAAKAEHSLKISAEIKYSNSDRSTHEIDNSLPFDFESTADESSISINATLPLFSGGQISSNRRRSYHTYLSANAEYAATLREVAQQTSTTHYQVETNRKRVSSRKEALTSNEKALTAVLRSYEAGATQLSEVLHTQKRYYSIKKSLIDSQIDYILSLARLKLLAGTLALDDIIKLNNLLIPPNQEQDR